MFRMNTAVSQTIPLPVMTQTRRSRLCSRCGQTNRYAGQPYDRWRDEVSLDEVE
jgi:hypothetical protein